MLPRIAIVLAGIGQLALALASLAIPRVLRWREDTAKLTTLTRQVFWTYAAYIWCIHVAFALLSLLATDALLDGSVLARTVTGFISVYWAARVVVQFAYFDRKGAPSTPMVRLAEAGLVALFVFLTLVYGSVALGAWS